MATLLPHFTSTVNNFTTGDLGNCFQRSVALVMDMKGSRLFVGTLENETHAYIHCWVGVENYFYDPVRFEDHDDELHAFDSEIFLASHKARNVREVSRDWVMAFARKGKVSEWMLDPVADHTFNVSLGEALLKRMKYAYRVDENGGILPA